MGKVKSAYHDILCHALTVAGIADDGIIQGLIMDDPERYPVQLDMWEKFGCESWRFRELVANIRQDFAKCHRCKANALVQLDSVWYCDTCYRRKFGRS